MSLEYPIGFYVYRLIDPRNSKCFYVGKGQRDRAWQHENGVRAGKSGSNPHKCAVISDILSAGHSVQIEIVAVFDDEVEALDLEFQLVESDPTLTNIMPGGVGPTWADSPLRTEQRYNVYRKRRAKLVMERAALRRDDRTDKFRERCRQFLNVPGAEPHRAEIEAWIASVEPPPAPDPASVVKRELKEARRAASARRQERGLPKGTKGRKHKCRRRRRKKREAELIVKAATKIDYSLPF